MTWKTALLVVGLTLFPAVVRAAGDGPLDTFGDWTAFAGSEGGKRFCYAGSVPKASEGTFSKRGDPYFLVTHRPAEKAFDVISVTSGFPYKSGSEVELTVGSQTFRLFTDQETGWARDADTDKAVVEAMRRGKSLIVKGVSTKGTVAQDTYSLDGVSAALDAIAKACNVK